MKSSTTLLSVMFLVASIGCSEPPQGNGETAEIASAAERYAPASYRRSHELFDRAAEAGPAEREALLEQAKAQLQTAVEESHTVRAAAREIAMRNIEEARLLVEIVRKLRSYDPPERYSIPSRTDLEEAEGLLAEAQAAFDSGNYVDAGLIAQRVTARMAQPKLAT